MQLRTLISLSAALLAVAPLAHASEVDGAWDMVYQTDQGPRTASMTVTTDGENVTAVMGETELSGTYRDGQLELSGEHYAAEAGYTATVTLTAHLEGDELKGEWEWSEYSSTFVATRAGQQP